MLIFTRELFWAKQFDATGRAKAITAATNSFFIIISLSFLNRESIETQIKIF